MTDDGQDELSPSERVPASPKRVLPQFGYRPLWWNWAGLYRMIDRRIERRNGDGAQTISVQGLRYFWIDGVFATLSENTIASFLAVFLLAYGATNSQIGALSSLGNLFGVMALIPAAIHAERARSPKSIVLWTGGGFGRIMILFLAIVPFVAPSPLAAIWMLIGINALRAFFNNYSNPAWTGIVADLVPESIRGRYFSDRNITMGVAALIVSAGGGLLVRTLNLYSGSGVLGFQAVFLLAMLFGVVATAAFARIPVPDRPMAQPGHRRPRFRSILREHHEFVAFLVGAFVWNLSIQTAAPFFNVYLVNELGGTVATVGYTAGIMSIFGLAGQRFFGSYADRHGPLKIIKICGFLIPIVPIAWGLSTQVWHVFAVVSFGGFVWAGYNLANFNLLLKLAPADARAGAAALYQLVVFTAAVVGPLIGGFLVDLLSYRPVFIVTGFGRLSGIIVLVVLMRAAERRRARTARP